MLGVNSKPQIKHIYCKHAGKRCFIYSWAVLEAQEIIFKLFPRRGPVALTRLAQVPLKQTKKKRSRRKGRLGMAGTMPDPTANVNMLKASGVSPQLASPCLSLVYALGPRWGSTGQVFSKLASNSQKLGWWGRGGGGPVLTRATGAPSSGQSGQSGQRAHTLGPPGPQEAAGAQEGLRGSKDRKSTRLNSSHT